jgi:uncharacterized repeat protein (TIGR01451 family)
VTHLSNQGIVSGLNFPADPTDDPTDEAYDNPTITPLTAAPLIEAFKHYELIDDVNNDGLPGPGDNLTYIVDIINKGNQNAPSISFADTIGENTTLIVGSTIVSQGTITSENTTGLNVNIGTILGSNHSATISFKVTIDPAATGSISNQGTVTALGLADILTDDPNTHIQHDSTYTALALSPPHLVVSKSALLVIDADNNDVPSPGDTLQYIVAINNNGGSAADNVTLNDIIDPDTTLIPGSTTTTQPAVINETLTSITANIGTLEGGLVHSICLVTFRVTIQSPLANGTIISNQGTVVADGNITLLTRCHR